MIFQRDSFTHLAVINRENETHCVPLLNPPDQFSIDGRVWAVVREYLGDCRDLLTLDGLIGGFRFTYLDFLIDHPIVSSPFATRCRGSDLMVEHGSARIWDVRWWHVTPEDAYDGVYGYIMHTVPIKCASGDFGLLFPTDMVKADFELPPTARVISFDNS